MSEKNSSESAVCQCCIHCQHQESGCYNCEVCYTCQIEIGTPLWMRGECRHPLSMKVYDKLLEESERKRQEIERGWLLWTFIKHVLSFRWLKISFNGDKRG